MKIYMAMPKALHCYYQTELDNCIKEQSMGNLQTAWRHLERAHILGQSYPYGHTVVHWKMLKFGIRIKSLREVIGQLPRLLVGGVKSFVGRIPVGNTGGSNVPALKSFPIEKELQHILDNTQFIEES